MTHEEMMALPKHTPGPWRLAGGVGPKGELYVWSDRDEKGKGYIGTHEICVAIIKPNARCEGSAAYAEEEIEANARLVVSAPEAFELLKNLNSILIQFTQYQGSKCHEQAKALIAKVEGN